MGESQPKIVLTEITEIASSVHIGLPQTKQQQGLQAMNIIADESRKLYIRNNTI